MQTAPVLNNVDCFEQTAKRQVDLLSLTMTALRINNNNSNNKTINSTDDRIITLDEVSWHDNAEDCWVIIYDRVYDLTTFLNEHPGGIDVLLEYAGRDATLAFRGSGHTKGAVALLKRYHIGILPINERLFRKTNGIKLSEIPE